MKATTRNILIPILLFSFSNAYADERICNVTSGGNVDYRSCYLLEDNKLTRLTSSGQKTGEAWKILEDGRVCKETSGHNVDYGNCFLLEEKKLTRITGSGQKTSEGWKVLEDGRICKMTSGGQVKFNECKKNVK
jgi:xanthine/CO dehydrogenase XdhC/CoxF family maturation factor